MREKQKEGTAGSAEIAETPKKTVADKPAKRLIKTVVKEKKMPEENVVEINGGDDSEILAELSLAKDGKTIKCSDKDCDYSVKNEKH